MWTISGSAKEYASERDAIDAAAIAVYQRRASVQVLKNGEVIRLVRY